MYEDGEMFEVASNEQYPDGVYMLLTDGSTSNH
jgi:hypothetical protein